LEIVHAGYLFKESGPFKLWKKHYFALTPSELKYYEGRSQEMNFFNLNQMLASLRKGALVSDRLQECQLSPLTRKIFQIA
jgi:hypothetical protein